MNPPGLVQLAGGVALIVIGYLIGRRRRTPRWTGNTPALAPMYLVRWSGSDGFARTASISNLTQARSLAALVSRHRGNVELVHPGTGYVERWVLGKLDVLPAPTQ